MPSLEEFSRESLYRGGIVARPVAVDQAISVERWPSLMREGPLQACMMRGGLASQTFNFRAAAAELFFQPLETTVQMIDTIDHGLALGGQTGDHQ